MTTETTPISSTGTGPTLPVSQSSLKPANGKRKRALLIVLAIVVLAGIGWLATTSWSAAGMKKPTMPTYRATWSP